VSITRIESARNPRFKNWLDLQSHARERRKQSLFLVEGLQETNYALKGGYRALEWIVPEGSKDCLFPNRIELSTALFEKLAYRGKNAACIGVFESSNRSLPPRPKRVLILENAEKPGNLGALIRTALAAGVDAVLATGEGADFFNPNCIRSSVGSVFLMPCAHVDNLSALEQILEWDMAIRLLRLDASQDVFLAELPERTAYVFGSESRGLSTFWSFEHLADRVRDLASLKIPMAVDIDSLNLSASAAVVLYEAYRRSEHRDEDRSVSFGH
jgi:TrmH family RNA methyltransferase